jgi:hypothetical protein
VNAWTNSLKKSLPSLSATAVARLPLTPPHAAPDPEVQL